MQFIDAVQIGEVVETQPVVLRATRQLMFVDARLCVGERMVGSASGIWKRLAEAGSV
jgi:predicted transcriptional regulator